MFRRPVSSDIQTDYLVIGAGVAGITLAQKLSENGLEVWLLGQPIHSQIAKAGPIKNVTSLKEGTIGADHIEELIKEAKKKGVKHKSSICTSIEVKDKITVKTKHQKFIANHVIIATGAKQVRQNFEGEEQFFPGGGISDCAACDYHLYKKKDVAVLGNHEYTYRAAEFLKPHAQKVYLLWLDTKLNFEFDEIKLFTNVSDIVATGSYDEMMKVSFLKEVSFKSDQGEQTIKITGLFVEGKPKPSSEFLEGSGIDMDDGGYIIIDENFKTNIPNLWAIGDVTGKSDSYDTALKHAIEISKEFID